MFNSFGCAAHPFFSHPKLPNVIEFQYINPPPIFHQNTMKKALAYTLSTHHIVPNGPNT